MPRVMIPIRAIDSRCINCPGLELEVNGNVIGDELSETRWNDIQCANYPKCKQVLKYHFENDKGTDAT